MERKNGFGRPDYPCFKPRERSQRSNSASRDLSSKQPSAIAFAARAEAVNALLGAERSAPGIVADQTKLAAAHGTAFDGRATLGLG